MEAIELRALLNVTITATRGVPRGTDAGFAGGVIDGNGEEWWGLPYVNFVGKDSTNRPRLLRIHGCEGCVLENILFLQPAYWTTKISGVDGMVIRNVGVSARRTSDEGHSFLDLSAFNTGRLRPYRFEAAPPETSSEQALLRRRLSPPSLTYVRTTTKSTPMVTQSADGLDVSGTNVHIHDCNIFVQDDCIAIKPHSLNGSSVGAASSNFLIEVKF